jgi:hypothetical protein
MRKVLSLAITLILGISLFAQNAKEPVLNTAEQMLEERESKLKIGGYGQIDYNQRVSKDTRFNGKLDVHRMVLFFGYQFTKDLHFVTEVEFEHVNELYVEQAFVDYRLNDYLSFRGGLMLVPMGIVNEFHEPTLFNGVERPSIDNIIVPTTWREIGAGIGGRIASASIKYQLYLFNGFYGYDGTNKLSGASGFRSARQKGINTNMSSPDLSLKVDYYGIQGLNIGLSGYFGNTESKLFNGLDKSSETARAAADSSTVKIAMAGLDFRYNTGAFQSRGQFIYASLGNSEAYNEFNDNKPKLGSAMTGWYLEAGYDLLHGKKMGLVPFVRYEHYNTHSSVAGNLVKNDAFNTDEFFAGIGFKPADGVVFKIDYQYKKSRQAGAVAENIINAGIGINF